MPRGRGWGAGWFGWGPGWGRGRGWGLGRGRGWWLGWGPYAPLYGATIPYMGYGYPYYGAAGVPYTPYRAYPYY